MEIKIFRPRAAGYIIAMTIIILFMVFCIIGFVIGLIEKNLLLIILPIPLNFVALVSFINLMQYKIIIGGNYISAPKVHSSYKSEYKKTHYTLKRYGKEKERIYFNEIEKINLKYEYVYRTSFIYLVFGCYNGKTKKIDTKLFGRKQVREIMEILNSKIQEQKK